MQRTLAFTILLMASFGLSAKAQLIDIQFGGNDFNGNTPAALQSGVGIVGSSGDIWNDFLSDSALESGVSLNYVGGPTDPSGASLKVTGTGSLYQYNDGGSGDNLPASVYNLAESELGDNTQLTLKFTGLADNTSYTINMLSAPDRWERSSSWAVNGGTAQTVGPLNSGPGGASPTFLDYGINYLTLTGTTDSSGVLTLVGKSVSGDVDINGLQLEATSAPEPSTYAMIMAAGLVTLVVIRRKRSMLV